MNFWWSDWLSTHSITKILYPVICPNMEIDRETQLLKQSIIVFSREVYMDWHLKPSVIYTYKVKCLVSNKTIIPLTPWTRVRGIIVK